MKLDKVFGWIQTGRAILGKLTDFLIAGRQKGYWLEGAGPEFGGPSRLISSPHQDTARRWLKAHEREIKSRDLDVCSIYLGGLLLAVESDAKGKGPDIGGPKR